MHSRAMGVLMTVALIVTACLNELNHTLRKRLVKP
jgi:hypothetical protein